MRKTDWCPFRCHSRTHSRGKDGERTSSLKLSSNTSRLNQIKELSKVVVSTKIRFLLAHGDTIGSPHLSGSLEGLKGGKDISSGSGGGGWGSSDGGCVVVSSLSVERCRKDE